MTCLMRAAARGGRAARPRTWLLARTRAVAALRAPRAGDAEDLDGALDHRPGELRLRPRRVRPGAGRRRLGRLELVAGVGAGARVVRVRHDEPAAVGRDVDVRGVPGRR